MWNGSQSDFGFRFRGSQQRTWAKFLIRNLEGLRWSLMSDLERVGAEFLATLVAYDMAARSSPCEEPVLPPDTDVEAEVEQRFRELVSEYEM